MDNLSKLFAKGQKTLNVYPKDAVLVWPTPRTVHEAKDRKVEIPKVYLVWVVTPPDDLMKMVVAEFPADELSATRVKETSLRDGRAYYLRDLRTAPGKWPKNADRSLDIAFTTDHVSLDSGRVILVTGANYSILPKPDALRLLEASG